MGVGVIMWLLIGASTLYHSFAIERIIEQNEMPTLTVDTSSGRRIPDTLFGIFFEVILLQTLLIFIHNHVKFSNSSNAILSTFCLSIWFTSLSTC